MKWFGLWVLWGGLAFGATPDSFSKNVFWSRPCAGLIASFLQVHPALSDRRRQVFEAVELSAKTTLHRLLQEKFESNWEIDINPTFLLNSNQLTVFNRRAVAQRMMSLHNAVGLRETLIGQLDGTERIDEFLERFSDQTQTFVDACQTPSAYREKELRGYLGQALCASGAVLTAAQLGVGGDLLPILASIGLTVFPAFLLPIDFPWILARERDGSSRETARLPALFDTAGRISRSEEKAPEWIHWAASVRFSYESLEEIWDQGLIPWVSPTLQAAMELDDTIRTMPFFERLATAYRAAKLRRKDAKAFQELQVQAYGPEVHFDFLLLKAGTLGLRHPRLLVAFRLPPHINEDREGGDGGGGSPRVPGPAPWESGLSPLLVH